MLRRGLAARSPRFQHLLVTGLAFSLAGDVFLMLKGYFIPGLASFLVAHLCYIALFRQGQRWFPSRGALVATLVRETNVVYQRIQSGELNIPLYLAQVYEALPRWVTELLDRAGLGNLTEIQERVTASLRQISQFVATQALSIGQNTLNLFVGFFVMLYLMFFLLRDGAGLARRIREAVPLNGDHKRELSAKFATVVKATVKGNVLVALAVNVALNAVLIPWLGMSGAALAWMAAMTWPAA